MNVIPEEVTIAGTFRTVSETWRTEAHLLIKQIATGIAQSYGAYCDIHIHKGYPALVNDISLTLRQKNQAIAYLGADAVVDLDVWMASEDFAFYARQIPGCFYRLGTGNVERNITAGLHTPQFDIEEKALENSCGLMAYLALKELGN
jgi:metal-dependent amidase/aminoacylase/carboxypeptidase family protein